MARKKSNATKVFKGIGIALLIALGVAVVCYFAVPEFKDLINNAFTDNKEATEGAVEAVKHLVIR